MQIRIQLTLILFCTTAIIGAPNFNFIKSAPLASYAPRREIRIYAGNSTSWSYQACIADSGPTGQIFGINLSTDTITSTNKTLANGALSNYELTMIQGLPDCSYAGQQNTTLFSQPPMLGEAPVDDWKGPIYAVWADNYVQIFLYTGVRVVNYLNLTTPGSFDYSATQDGTDDIRSWELYQDPTSKIFYIVVSVGLADGWASFMYKCDPSCSRQDDHMDLSAFATVTASSTHWFSCYKKFSLSINQTIESGSYACKHSADTVPTYYLYDIDQDYPVNITKNDRLYSCMMGDNNMILAVSSSINQSYALYTLDTTNGFAVTRKSDSASLTVMSISCMDQVILVTTQNSVDYWVWDDGSGFSFSPAVPTALSGDVPSSNQPSTPSNELSDENKIIVGVVIGAGAPLIAGAIALILLRKRLRKKKSTEESTTTYSSIILPSKESRLFQKKMFIPFKQLSFTTEIGSGSFGKVFLGKWQGALVAIKKNNQASSDANFLAEAKLTLSMPPHPNLVQTYGVCTDSENAYIVLEYCEGGSLDKIAFNRPLDQKEQRALVLGVAYGLAHLHRHNIIHRDLAARNILLKDGIPKISDFGMSRVLKDESAQGKTATTIGPIRWMAPESVNDMSYSYKSDVWTFAIVVSEIVNGHEPHEGENQLDVAMDIRDEGYTPSLPENCDPVLAELMQMCWKVNPDERPTMPDLVAFLNSKFALTE